MELIPVNTESEVSSATETLVSPETIQELIDKVEVDDLPIQELERLKSLIGRFASLLTNTDLTGVKNVEHSIQTQEGTRPIRCDSYRAGWEARREIEQQVKYLLDKRLVQPSQSPWDFLVILAKKPNSKWRFCVDYRRLNAVTFMDAYPIPRMDDAIDSLSQAKYFSTMDAEKGFWQVPMDPVYREKTAFVTHVGQLEWLRMPMGLQNSPATFQSLMDAVFAGLTWSMCLVYVDDIIVYSNTIEEHFLSLEIVFDQLRSAGISLNSGKCSFFRLQVPYLEFIIQNGQVSADSEKTKVVKELKTTLLSQTEVRSFLGLCGVYRKFIKNYATISQPLVELTKDVHPSY